MSRTDSACLLISCSDQEGIVAALSTFIRRHDGNIASSAQHTTDPEGGQFFMRTEFAAPGLDERREAFEVAFREHVGEPFGMEWRISYRSTPPRVALFASRYDHCLLDLLWRQRRGELPCEIDLVVSNHEDLRAEVELLGIDYVHVPVSRETKADAEAQALRVLDGRFDLIVLARYMQILSPEFIEAAGTPIINIHHSFLPAFAGANPYERARERGVKIIGATAHYVTEELDAGPIIEQDIARVTHADDVEALTRTGADIERLVLARAVRWHLEDRVLVHVCRTVVFY